MKDLALAGGSLLAFALFASSGDEIGLQITDSLFDISLKLESSSVVCLLLSRPLSLRVRRERRRRLNLSHRPKGGGSTGGPFISPTRAKRWGEYRRRRSRGGGLVPTDAA